MIGPVRGDSRGPKDIEHELEGLTGSEYGRVVSILSRAVER
jgi:hypothetical protein